MHMCSGLHNKRVFLPYELGEQFSVPMNGSQLEASQVSSSHNSAVGSGQKAQPLAPSTCNEFHNIKLVLSDLLKFSHEWQIRSVILQGVGHEHHIHVIKGSLPQQVYFTSTFLLSWSPQDCHLWRLLLLLKISTARNVIGRLSPRFCTAMNSNQSFLTK